MWKSPKWEQKWALTRSLQRYGKLIRLAGNIKWKELEKSVTRTFKTSNKEWWLWCKYIKNSQRSRETFGFLNKGGITIMKGEKGGEFEWIFYFGPPYQGCWRDTHPRTAFSMDSIWRTKSPEMARDEILGPNDKMKEINWSWSVDDIYLKGLKSSHTHPSRWKQSLYQKVGR